LSRHGQQNETSARPRKGLSPKSASVFKIQPARTF
jgi:hypothetical protein